MRAASVGLGSSGKVGAMRTRELVLIAILAAQSLLLFMLENQIPLPVLPPGAKLGLSNIFIIMGFLLLDDFRSVLLLLILKLALSMLIAGTPIVFLYSAAGGVLSTVGMYLLFRSGLFTMGAVSAAGGFLHNLGQVTVAIWLLASDFLIFYFTVLGLVGLVTGYINGFLAQKMTRYLKIYQKYGG